MPEAAVIHKNTFRESVNMNRRWYREILRRRLFIILLLLIQIAFLVFVLLSDNRAVSVISTAIKIAGIFLALKVIYEPGNGSMKTGWILLLLILPVAGAFLYLLVHFQSSTRRFRNALNEIDRADASALLLYENAENRASSEFPEYSTVFKYLQNKMMFPVFDCSGTRYLSPGEKFLPLFLEDLKSAQRYIFLEYFIVQEGKMWDSVLEILEQKAAEGVEVRVMYDDVGCFVRLPRDYRKTLEAKGIRCMVFNPFRPMLSVIQNNRDHRKITVIDGKIAYTGGLNLADEYINAYEVHGYWKDCALRMEGKAAWSMTVIFFELWQLCSGKKEEVKAYFPGCTFNAETPGYVQPYADSPMDSENVGEQVYLQMIYSARHTLYITTPYLILDDRMVSALSLAAKSGVDVRIITPHIADHKLVSVVTRSYYHTLINNGIKLYEYSRGFIHSKNFIVDGKAAAIGTINLDFRSLYLHFECGVFQCGTDSVAEAEKDFLDSVSVCHRIGPEDCRAGLLMRLFQEVLRLFSPLM